MKMNVWQMALFLAGTVHLNGGLTGARPLEPPAVGGRNQGVQGFELRPLLSPQEIRPRLAPERIHQPPVQPPAMAPWWPLRSFSNSV